MIIKNLGPLKYAQITVSPLTVFFGNNGTGKTLAQYSIFSFLDWVESNYKHLVVVSEKELVSMIVGGESKTITLDKFRESITQQIISQFNALDSNYFQNFFKDNNVYKEGFSSIVIDEQDVTSIIKYDGLPNKRSYSWAFTKSNMNVANSENSMELEQSNALSIDFNNTYFKMEYSLMDRSGYNIDTKNNISIDDRKRQVTEQSTVPLRVIKNFFNEGILSIFLSSKNVYLPAERIGINTFRKVLIDKQLSAIGGLNDSSQINKLENLVDYPRPINSYMSFTSSRPSIIPATKKGGYLHEHLQKLIPGNFEYDENSDSVFFNMNNGQSHLSFKLLSSSLKSLYGLEHFIAVSHRGDSLFIDEPEMNLHPEGQITIMELLYLLVKFGENRLVLSTHSDYLVKKLINLLLKDKRDSGSKGTDVSVYIFKDGGAQKIDDITNEDGDGTLNFDGPSISLNEEYYSLID